MKVIEVENLSFSYPGSGKKILKNVSLKIEKGEAVALIGPNGSGKSTLGLIVSSLLRGYEGKITPPDEERRMLCRIVFQNPDNQIIGETVEEDVAFTPENLNYDCDKIRELVERALKITRLEEKRYHKPSSLSGGERQREAVASAIAVPPMLLILDEAGSMLDRKSMDYIFSILFEECRKGDLSLLYITHNTEEAALADRVYILNDGVMVKEGKPEDVLTYKTLTQNHLSLPYALALSHELGLSETLSLSLLADEIEGRLER